MWRHGAPRSLTYNTAVMPKLSVAAVLSAAVAFGPQATLPRERVSHELPQHETAHLTIATSSDPAAVAPGQKVTLTVAVTPKPKIHVYAPGQEGYIPISLTLEPAPAVAAAKAKYPAGEKFLMPALNETQIVYDKPFRITQELKIGATHDLAKRAAEGGSLIVKGTVRYQACDDKICFLPTNVPVEWSIKLAPAR
jgi:DsbC/DsbD-like thiol-disulfide interchange protein